MELGLANVLGRGTWSYRCTLSDSVELERIRLLMNYLIQNLALIKSMCIIWNEVGALESVFSMPVGEEEGDVETWRWGIR